MAGDDLMSENVSKAHFWTPPGVIATSLPPEASPKLTFPDTVA